MDKTVMQYEENGTYTEQQQLEYQQAVEKGFSGTIEEFLQYRDYL